MFGLLMGDTPLTYTVAVGNGIVQHSNGGTPPVVEYCWIQDINGNDLLDMLDFELNSKCGKIYQLYSNNEYKLADYLEFLLGVRS